HLAGMRFAAGSPTGARPGALHRAGPPPRRAGVIDVPGFFFQEPTGRRGARFRAAISDAGGMGGEGRPLTPSGPDTAENAAIGPPLPSCTIARSEDCRKGVPRANRSPCSRNLVQPCLCFARTPIRVPAASALAAGLVPTSETAGTEAAAVAICREQAHE